MPSLANSARVGPLRAPLLVLRSRRVLARLGDERLVEQFRRGNPAAFEAIYDRHHAAILSFCRHMLGSREDAEDAVQHTFTVAARDLPSGHAPVTLRPWLFTVARNRCVSILRARRTTERPVSEPVGRALADEVEQRVEFRHLLDDLATLPPDQRAALVLSQVQAMPHVEIARVLGCPPRRVKSLIFRARSALIARRRARERSCEELREEMAALTPRTALPADVKLHLRSCTACASFQDELRRQRRALTALAPLLPSAGLREAVLAAAGIVAPGGGTAAAVGHQAGIWSLKAAAAKLGVFAIAAAGGTAAGEVTERRDRAPAAVSGGDARAEGGRGAAGALARSDSSKEPAVRRPPVRGAGRRGLGARGVRTPPRRRSDGASAGPVRPGGGRRTGPVASPAAGGAAGGGATAPPAAATVADEAPAVGGVGRGPGEEDGRGRADQAPDEHAKRHDGLRGRGRGGGRAKPPAGGDRKAPGGKRAKAPGGKRAEAPGGGRRKARGTERGEAPGGGEPKAPGTGRGKAPGRGERKRRADGDRKPLGDADGKGRAHAQPPAPAS